MSRYDGSAAMPFDRARASPEFPADYAHVRPVVIRDGWDVAGGDVLVARRGHLQRRGQVRPQLEAVHPPLRIPLRHLLVDDAAARGHPLHVAGAQRAGVAEAVAVRDFAGEHVGDRLDAAMRMPRKSVEEIRRTIVPEIVEQQERIELGGIAEPESTVQLDACPLHGRGRLGNALDGSDGHALGLLVSS